MNTNGTQRTGFTRGAVNAWRWLRRLWNVVRPGWPVPAFMILGVSAIIFSGQGQEILYAVSDPANPRFGLSFGSTFVSSVLAYIIFLVAICGYYPDYSDRALQGVLPRFLSAAAVGLSMPTLLALYFLVRALSGGCIAGARVIGLCQPAGSGFWASFTIIAALILTFAYLRRTGMRLFPSPFSIIMVVSDRLRGALFALLLLGAGIAAASLVFPAVPRFLGPLAIAQIGITLWASAFTYIVSVFERRDWIPPVLILAVLAVAVANFGGVRAQTPLQPAPVTELPADALSHARAWLAARAGPGANRQRAIVILAEGGGIRAAVHAATTLAALDEASNGALFEDAYVISGVSGGSVGVATFLAARAAEAEAAGRPGAPLNRQTRAAVSSRIAEVFDRDHFSPLLAGLFFIDAPLSLVPTPLPSGTEDRARRFEASWAESLPPLAQSFDRVLRAAGGPHGPAVIANTVRSDTGRLEVVSNIRFDRRRSPAAPCNVLDRLPPQRTLSMISAAHLSARFPMVSPPAALESAAGACDEPAQWLRYVDGGYLDNSGALSAREAVAALRRAAAERGVEIDFVVLHLFARITAPAAAAQDANVAPELTAPINALVGVRNVQGLAPIENLCRLLDRPAGAEGGQDICASLAGHRVRRAGDAASLAAANFCPLRLAWINAHLDVDELNPSSDSYVPLGWLLGRSRAYVQRQTQERVSQIAPLLRGDARASVACSSPPG